MIPFRGEGGARAAKRGSGSGNGGGSGIKEQHIAFLLKAGCLTRQQRTAGSPEAFWFALPGAGPVLKEARAGRQVGSHHPSPPPPLALIPVYRPYGQTPLHHSLCCMNMWLTRVSLNSASKSLPLSVRGQM